VRYPRISKCGALQGVRVIRLELGLIVRASQMPSQAESFNNLMMRAYGLSRRFSLRDPPPASSLRKEKKYRNDGTQVTLRPG
jgi:hypothetical protein